MRKILDLVVFLLLVSCLNAQSKKVKVYLLGTFHFKQTEDSYNVLDLKHQKEIEKLNNIVIKLHPNKVFVERMPEFEYMNKMDSVYKDYVLNNRVLTDRNEIYQIGFKIAKELKHPKVYACDNPGKFGGLYNNLKKYSEKNNQTDFLEYKKMGETRPLLSLLDSDSIRRNVSLLEYVKFMNSKQVLETSHAAYINVYPRIGQTDVYKRFTEDYLLGTELTADWYRRNIYIYSKILNQIDYSEKSIFVVIGNDHVSILKHLFESNPFFEVMNTQKWLGKSKIKYN